jgi:hypothetical protein
MATTDASSSYLGLPLDPLPEHMHDACIPHHMCRFAGRLFLPPRHALVPLHFCFLFSYLCNSHLRNGWSRSSPPVENFLFRLTFFFQHMAGDWTGEPPRTFLLQSLLHVH